MSGPENHYIATASTALQAEGFSLAQLISDKSDSAVERHGHAHAHIVLVTGGEFRSDVERGEAGALKPLVFNPAQTYHSDRFVHGGGSFFIVTLPSADDGALGELDLPTEPILVDDLRVRARMIDLMGRLRDADTDGLDVAALSLELVAALGRPGRLDRARPAWLDGVIEMLLDHPVDAPLTINGVADRFGLDPAYLVRSFRKFLHCTPGDFRRMRRLGQAADLLARTRLPVAEIALETGFSDQSHLSTQFGRWFCVSPARYRRMAS